jgi:hypothetical protein
MSRQSGSGEDSFGLVTDADGYKTSERKSWSGQISAGSVPTKFCQCEHTPVSVGMNVRAIQCIE